MIEVRRRVLQAQAALVVVGFVVAVFPAYSLDTFPGRSPSNAGISNGAALSVSPAIIEQASDAGASLMSSITITNITDSPMTVRSMARELVPEENVDPSYKSAYDASSWFRITEPDFLLLAREQKTVKIVIDIPSGAEPGGHYATVYFESAVPERENVSETSTLINARVGVLALLIVKGEVREHATADQPIHTQLIQTGIDPTKFKIAIKNDGNVHMLPTGKLTVRRVFGQKSEELSFPLGMLLPGTEREYEVTWKHGLLVGMYEAGATLTVGTDQTTLKPEPARFALIPVLLLLPVVCLLIASALLMGLALRYRGRSHRKKKTHTGSGINPHEPLPSC